jgi:hypothetical protein
VEHSLSRGLLLLSGNHGWTCADLPWRRLDADGIEVPGPDHDEPVSNLTPFMQWGAGLLQRNPEALRGANGARVGRELWPAGSRRRKVRRAKGACVSLLKPD